MRKPAMAAAVIILTSFLLNAQPLPTQNTGRLKGRISDTLGAAIEKTQIIVESPQASFEATADEYGEYDIKVPAGIYTVSTKKMPGFIPFKQEGIEVEAGKTTILNIELKVTLKDADCVLLITTSPKKKTGTSRKR